jgi:hypothetical protein
MPFDDADVVVVEQAHLRERNVYSVSQVYTLDELRKLRCAAKVKLFPGKLVWRASEFAGNVDSDGKPIKDFDAESIAVYSAAHPAQRASWKRFVLPENDPARRLWPYRDALRADLQEALNPLRAAWNAMPTAQRYALPEVKRFCDLLNDVYDQLTPGIREQYGIRRTRNGIRVERMASAITLYLAVYTREGRLRTRPDGGFIGVRFILDAIGLSHSHKPNMARSQLTWHGMRHYKGGRAGRQRCAYMRNLRHFLALMRDSAGDSLIEDSALDALTLHSVPSSGQLALSWADVPDFQEVSV